ncbi:outer membrane beta-barrel protein [Frigidibacter sp. RF13]|uniref:outer membrane protein n=1 Tax=Frigidibacter sp. RF13 TaxID=2997340 RepID=UPI00227127E7|nr:outer membrane beta-barrel protein [Frigidibacter sp. RF13]MCY1125609.1 outer membrane beta-barrel protein [Frigidibacter sp. RF13]
MKEALFKAGLALAFGATLAVPASAGGLSAPQSEAPVVAPAPIIAPSADWTGGWVGAKLGYGDASYGANDGTGATYGIAGGYDWDFGQWIAGVGLDWDKTNIDLGNAGDNLDSIARLKFRAGADLGRTFLYGTAGAARAKADIGGASVSDNGWFGGVGLDYALTNQWTLGGEILTNRFNDFGNTGTDLDATTASVNLGFRF